MSPRSPISASVAAWLASVRAYFAYKTSADTDGSDVTAPLAGTLVRIQARYGSLNARIQREAERLALWLLAKVDLPKDIAHLLVEGLSPVGDVAYRTGRVPVFKHTPGSPRHDVLELTTRGGELVFDDEAADDAAYEVPRRARSSRVRRNG